MSVNYQLVNQTRRELVLFAHVSASSQREIAGNPVASAITAWYLLTHKGDEIAFVSDTYGDWPFSSGSGEDLSSYTGMTEAVVNELIAAGILQDHGKAWVDTDEPDTVYIRDLRNCWMDKGAN